MILGEINSNQLSTGGGELLTLKNIDFQCRQSVPKTIFRNWGTVPERLNIFRELVDSLKKENNTFLLELSYTFLWGVVCVF